MRLLDLGLDRYGPFTGRRLSFRPDARLHVVLGPNEAGKSSALAAITDLLFGIPTRPTSDFLHQAKDLTLSAEIAARDGRRLQFTRRKNKPQLTDATGQPFGPEVLADYLGGIGREAFGKAFGLDAAALRQAGHELGDTGGELGAALFSAAAGLRGLEALKKALTAEAEALYIPAGRTRAFNVARSRYDALGQAERTAVLGGEALKRLTTESAEATARLDAIARESQTLAAERARLARLGLARLPLARLAEGRARLAALGDLPAVEAGFGDRLAAALTAAKAATEAAEQARTRAARARDLVETLRPEAALIERADDIVALAGDAAALRQAAAEAPVLAERAARLDASLADLAARLGLAAAEDVAAKRPDDATLARVGGAVETGNRLRDRLMAARQEHARRDQALTDRRAVTGDATTLDPAPLAERFAALRPALDRLAGVAEERARLATELAQADAAARRLDPDVADLARLATAALPGRDTIDAAAIRARGLADRLRDADKDVAEARRRLADAEAAVARLAAGGDLPTPERIAAVRAARDGLWREIEAGLARGAVPAALATDYEAALRAADALADAAVVEAARVGDWRRAEADRVDAARRLGEAEAARTEAAAAVAAEDAAWRATWAPFDLTPAPPEAMRGWRGAVETLIAQRDKVLARDAELAAAAAEAAGVPALLAALAVELGLPPLDGLPAQDASRRVGEALAARARGFAAAREAMLELAGLEREAKAAAAALAEAEEEARRWRRGLAEDWAAFGLKPDAGLDEAAARLAAWREVPGVLGARAEVARRIDQDAERLRLFAERVARLVGEAAPDLATLRPERAVAVLAERLTEARDLAARRTVALTHAGDLAAQAAEAETAAAEVGEAVALMLARAGSPVDPADLAARLVARDALTRDIVRDGDELARIAGGVDVESLTAELATLPPDAAAARDAELEAAEQRLREEADGLRLKRAQTDALLAARGDVVTAEVAAQERRIAEAELAETAETWLVTALAAAMLGRAIEVKRGADHGPMMARAGALFARLTDGAFAGIGQDYDEKEQPMVVGRRAVGGTVEVPGMSEGTRDQLFLALRLAYLERFAIDAEPPPFIGDDLFASFDDRRTRAGLATLAEIGASVQPILFTHHGRVADMATAELGADVEVIEL
jgi:uncharacterized protein YhaN